MDRLVLPRNVMTPSRAISTRAAQTGGNAMKGKVDERRGKKPVFKGGKALVRLFYFGSQRQAKLNDAAIEASGASKSAVPKWATASSHTRSRQKGAINSVEGFSEAYASVAVDLASAPPTAPTAAPGINQPAPPPAALLAQWKSIGPTYITNGQTYGASRVDVSGRVACVAVDPSNNLHMLCGSAGGGIWESTDAGANWLPRTDHMPTLTIGALAFDPANPKIVYAGSGEGNFYASLGAGVYVSADGGTTWKLLTAAPFSGQGFYDLIVDPTNSKILYAASTDGFYLSTNAGVAWTRKRSARCWDISVHPKAGGKEILAACDDGVFVSVNFGANFSAVNLPAALTPPWTRLAVDHCPTDGRIAFVFGAKGTFGRLYQRSSTGAWTQKTMPPNLSLNQAWYDWHVRASDKVGQVYVGAIDLWRGDPKDNALNWINLSTKTGANSSSIHPDQHCLTIDPKTPDTIYAGNDGGLFVSRDRGIVWKTLNRSLGITEIEFIATRPDNSKWLLAGTQDNGTNRFIGNLNWEHVADGDGGDCAVNPSEPNEAYHTFYGIQTVERSTAAGAWATWTTINIPGTGSALFYPPLEVFGRTVARAGDQAFVSRNSGGSWTAVGGLGFGPGQLASAMTMPTADRFFVGSTGGALCRVDFSGNTWTASPLKSPRAAWVSDIAVDPHDPKTLWLTYTTVNGPRVYQSHDAGATWADRTTNLPPLPINAICIDPKNSSRVFAAADLGVYESVNGGTSWSVFGTGLPNALAVDLALHEKDRVLFCATRNRGCWIIGV